MLRLCRYYICSSGRVLTRVIEQSLGTLVSQNNLFQPHVWHKTFQFNSLRLISEYPMKLPGTPFSQLSLTNEAGITQKYLG